MSKAKPQIPTDLLVARLRLMAEVGGMITNDREEAIRQAADRLDEYLLDKAGETHEEH